MLDGKGAAVVLTVVSLAFAVRLANPDRDFGVSVRSGSTIAAAPVLSQYCAEHRASDLYILAVDDEFLSAALPLHRVRYGWVDASGMVAREHPHLAYLGILVPAGELPRLNEKMPVYRERLRAWGLDSTDAVATGIAANDVAGLLRIIHDHPEGDFLVARSILPNPEREESHRVRFANSEFALLESKSAVGKEMIGWTCGM